MTDFNQAIQQALTGSRKLKGTIKPGEMNVVKDLCGLERGGIIRIDDTTAINLTAVMNSGQWGDDSNRVIIFELAENFEAKWFVERIQLAFEKIEVLV